MRTRIKGFPWIELSEDEAKDDEFIARVRQHATELADCYTEGEAEEIDRLLEAEPFQMDGMAILSGLCHDTWITKTKRGVACRDDLSDVLLSIAIFWCGVAAARGFLAGVRHHDQTANFDTLWATLEAAGLECLEAKEDDNDVG